MEVYINDSSDGSDLQSLGWYLPSEVDDVINLVKKYNVMGEYGTLYQFSDVSFVIGDNGLECWIDVSVI